MGVRCWDSSVNADRQDNVRPLAIAPNTLEYRGHVITLEHRGRYNDWQYRYETTIVLTQTGHFPRRQKAVEEAKKRIDKMLDGS